MPAVCRTAGRVRASTRDRAVLFMRNNSAMSGPRFYDQNALLRAEIDRAAGWPEAKAASARTVPALRSLKVVVDPAIPRDELRVHPAMFDLLQRAFLEADSQRGIRPAKEIGSASDQPTADTSAELEIWLQAFDRDWIKAGQPDPTMTIRLVSEIKRLRRAVEFWQEKAT